MSEELDTRRLSFYLSALRELAEALAASPNRADSAGPLRENLYRIMGTFAAGRGMLLLWDEAERRLAPAAAKGMRPGRAFTIELTPARARALAARPRAFRPRMPPGGCEDLCARLATAMERARLEWAAPLARSGRLVGLLLVGSPVSGGALGPVQLEVLEEMALLLALSIEDSRQRRRLNAELRSLRAQGRHLRQIYLETLRAFAGIIDGPGPERPGKPGAEDQPGHSARVAALAAETGHRLGLTRQVCDRLYMAGLLHDVGKQIISRDLLEKSEPLEVGERVRLEDHPRLGYELISHLRFPWGDVARIIRHHHERPDGRGYPDRLSGDQISIEARVLMMAEAFDSMTSDQPWRPRLRFEQVVEQIHANLGLQFDPRVAGALCQAVADGLEGNARERDFVPHLEAGFDPAVIRGLLEELRRQIATPTFRPKARVIELGEEPGEP